MRYLPFTNGVFDLGTRTFSKGFPHHLATLTLGVPYREFAADDSDLRFVHHFLSQLFVDQDVRKYALRVLSGALAGNEFKHVAMLYGPPGGGKSQLVYLLKAAMGQLYADLPFQAVMRGGMSAAGGTAEHLAQLQGKRIAVTPELPANGTYDSAAIKVLSSGSDTILCTAEVSIKKRAM